MTAQKENTLKKIIAATEKSRAQRENLYFVLNPVNGEIVEKPFCAANIIHEKGVTLWDITGAANKRSFQLELVNKWNRDSARHKMGFVYFLAI